MVCSKSSILRRLESFIAPFFRLVSIMISKGITPSNSFSKKRISSKKVVFFGMSSMMLPETFILLIPIIPKTKRQTAVT